MCDIRISNEVDIAVENILDNERETFDESKRNIMNFIRGASFEDIERLIFKVYYIGAADGFEEGYDW